MFSAILLPCDRCRLALPIACCWCDLELCEECALAHLPACGYAKQFRFRTWRGREASDRR